MTTAPRPNADPTLHRRALGVCLGLIVASSALACARGSGTPAQQERDAKGFTQIHVGGAFEIDVDVGPAGTEEWRVVVSGDDNLLERIVTEVDGDTLEVRLEGTVVTKSPLRAEISLPTLTDVDLSGATRADIDGIAGESFDLDASGATHVVAHGKTSALGIDASGATEVDAREIEARSVRINVSGATEATVTATEAIDADASGSSTVRYFGDPKTVKTDTSGASSIEPG